MAQPVKNQAVAVSNKDILAEVNLISQIQQIETRLAVQPRSMRFAQLADAYINMGQYDDGILICEEGLKNYPHYVTASLVLAKGYYYSGNKNKARQILEDFLHVRPSHIAARKMLGDIALENDDVKTAVGHYRVALRLDPINRDIIQALVDLKDQYQKIKDGATSEDEEDDVIRPREKAPLTRTVAPTETRPPAKDIKTTAPKKDLTEEIEQVEDSIVASLMGDEPVERPPVKAVGETVPKPVVEEVKPAAQPVEASRVETSPTAGTTPILETAGLTPAFTDARGMLYFYADEDLSFAHFKARNDLVKQGRAVVMARTELDQLIAKASGKATPAADETPVVDLEEKLEAPPRKPVLDFDDAFEVGEIRKPTPKPPMVETPVEEELSSEESDEPLTKEEQEVILSEVEVSYRDYLDLITDEEELLEAIFQDEQPATHDDETSPIVAEITGIQRRTVTDAGDAPLSYDDYLSTLDDEDLVAEASFEEEAPMSLEDYASYLDESDEPIDFAMYSLVTGQNGELWRSFDPGEERVLSYRDYLAEPLTNETRTEATFTGTVVVPDAVAVESAAIVDTAIHKEAAAFVEVQKRTEPEPVRTEPAPVVETAAVDEEETVEYVDEEEDINPADVSMELAEQYASRGQFGAAFKVCRMLKLNNPTDAKIDRKILELKRLYVWSTQMVG